MSDDNHLLAPLLAAEWRGTGERFSGGSGNNNNNDNQDV